MAAYREDFRGELIALMDRHELTRKDVADLLEGLATPRAVKAWRIGQNPTPKWAVDLLRAALAKR